jgi:very-short-patch-repair endonuclease
VTEELERRGGVAASKVLVGATSRRDLELALRDASVVRLSRGRYALPTGSAARRAAHELSAVAVGLSAAAHHGLLLKWQPKRPHLVVPRGRRVPAAAQQANDVSWRRIPGAAVEDGWVLRPAFTVVDCASRLPFDEALAVADCALRFGRVSGEGLEQAQATWPRGRSLRVSQVLAAADAQAQGPFESVLRAIALDVPGLRVVTQHRIDVEGGFLARVDLADLRLRMVLEADSFEFHGLPELMDKDCRRYDELVVDGWLVLRFSWSQVMTKDEWVRSVLERGVAVRERQLLLSA